MKFLPCITVLFFLSIAGCENQPAVEQKTVAEKSKATEDKSEMPVEKTKTGEQKTKESSDLEGKIKSGEVKKYEDLIPIIGKEAIITPVGKGFSRYWWYTKKDKPSVILIDISNAEKTIIKYKDFSINPSVNRKAGWDLYQRIIKSPGIIKVSELRERLGAEYNGERNKIGGYFLSWYVDDVNLTVGVDPTGKRAISIHWGEPTF